MVPLVLCTLAQVELVSSAFFRAQERAPAPAEPQWLPRKGWERALQQAGHTLGAGTGAGSNRISSTPALWSTLVGLAVVPARPLSSTSGAQSGPVVTVFQLPALPAQLWVCCAPHPGFQHHCKHAR